MTMRIGNTELPQITTEAVTPKNQTLSFRGNDYERTPDSDKFEKKKDNTVRNVVIGTGAALALGVLADYAFAHGKHVKKLLGIAEKDAKKPGEGSKPKPEEPPKPDNVPNPAEPPKPEVVPETKPDGSPAANESVDPTDVPAPNEPPKPENVPNSKKNAGEEIKTESEKAKAEAEKAAKEAQKKLQDEYIKEMDGIAKTKANELKAKWNQKLEKFTRLYLNGFEKLRRGKKVETLEDGTKKVTIKYKNVMTEYYSKDGKSLDCIKEFDKSGNLILDVELGLNEGRNGQLRVFTPEHDLVERMAFNTSDYKSKGDRLINWNRCYTTQCSSPEEVMKIYPESRTQVQLNRLYFDGSEQIEWHALPEKEIADGLSLSNGVNL